MNSFISSKRAIEINNVQNHDLRESSFNILNFLYWVKKYIDSPDVKNKKSVFSEIKEIEISEEINTRIFTNEKNAPRAISNFDLDEELQKIVSFLGVELNLDQFSYVPVKNILVSSDLNAFTVLLINLLRSDLISNRFLVSFDTL